MRFNRYPDIKNVDVKNIIKAMQILSVPSDVFVVQEKVHGANLGVLCDGKSVAFSSRNQLVSDSFYGLFDGLSKHLEVLARGVFDELRDYYQGIKQVTVCGELAGGEYNHPSVESHKDPRVQPKVQYAPMNVFFGFDILVTYCDDTTEFLPVIFAMDLLRDIGFLTCSILYQGTLEECIKFPNKYITNQAIDSDNNTLPQIDDNFCEGNVIKPNEEMYFSSNERAALKNKNDQFVEKKRNSHVLSFHDVGKNGELFVEVLSYINDNRVHGMIGKMGEMITIRKLPRVSGLVVQDALVDFVADNPTALDKLEKDERKTMNKLLNQQAEIEVRAIYDEMVET